MTASICLLGKLGCCHCLMITSLVVWKNHLFITKFFYAAIRSANVTAQLALKTTISQY